MYCQSKKNPENSFKKGEESVIFRQFKNVPESTFDVVQKMCHRVYQRRKSKKLVLPVE